MILSKQICTLKLLAKKGHRKKILNYRYFLSVTLLQSTHTQKEVVMNDDNAMSPTEKFFQTVVVFLLLSVMTLFFAGVTSIQVGLLFRAEFAQSYMTMPPLTNVPMWAGAILWAMPTLAFWFEAIYRRRKDFIVPAILLTCITFISIAGIYSPWARMFAHFMNSVIWALFTFCGGQATYEWCKGENPFPDTATEPGNK